jgi:hypothetical protein
VISVTNVTNVIKKSGQKKSKTKKPAIHPDAGFFAKLKNKFISLHYHAHRHQPFEYGTS